MEDHKSIEDLENDYWTYTDFPTSLVEQCYNYRKVPIKDLTVEEIRLMISQNIGADFLLPKALELLKNNVLAEGDCYPGDLLSSVLALQKWKDVKLKSDFRSLLQKERQFIGSKNKENHYRQLLKAVDQFLSPDEVTVT